MATKKTATKKTATKKTATKKKVAKNAPVAADVEVAPAYTAWTPTDMPVGGKSNSTEQLNDHPTEHNHTASAVSDIVDRFADLRLYVPGVNSCGIAGDLKVDGNSDLKINVPDDFWMPVSGTVFTALGMIGGTQGSNATSMTSNGYRNTDGKWTSLGAGGSRGAVQISLLPTGTFEVRTAANHPTGSTVQPPLRFSVADGLTRAYGDIQVDGQTKTQNGTNAAPGYSFTSDTKTGLYLYSKGIASIACDGKNVANFGTDGVAFPEGLATITGTAANIHIDPADGQLRRITDVAKTPTTADIERLETLVEKLSARIEELEGSLRPAAKPAAS